MSADADSDDHGEDGEETHYIVEIDAEAPFTPPKEWWQDHGVPRHTHSIPCDSVEHLDDGTQLRLGLDETDETWTLNNDERITEVRTVAGPRPRTADGTKDENG